MDKKDLHIVFGFTAKAILSQSNYVNAEQGEIVRFYDPLSLRPLCDMDNATAIEERKMWLNEALGSIETENSSNFVDDNLDLIKTIVADNQKIKRIFLWLGEGR